MEVFVYCNRIDAPSNEVFAWHCRDGSFGRLDPRWRQHFIVKKRERERKGGIIAVMVVRYYSNALS